MYHIIQENLFREEGFEKLISALNRTDLKYELVKVLPFVEEFEYTTKRKDIFVFGSLKLARLSKDLDWYPGTLITDNHDYEVYSKKYKYHLLNHDSKIHKFGDAFPWKYDQMFIRIGPGSEESFMKRSTNN